MSGGEPSSIKRICPCAARMPFLSQLHGKRVWLQIRVWVCDLIMGRSGVFFINAGVRLICLTPVFAVRQGFFVTPGLLFFGISIILLRNGGEQDVSGALPEIPAAEL